MKSFRRWLRIAAVAICTATILLWIRSDIANDSYLWQTSPNSFEYFESSGGMFYWVDAETENSLPIAVAAHGWRTNGGLNFGGCSYGGCLPFGYFFEDGGEIVIQNATFSYSLDRVPYVYWVFLSALMLLGPVAFRFAMRFFKPQRPGMCATCGYDLRATPNRCPECGRIPAGAKT